MLSTLHRGDTEEQRLAGDVPRITPSLNVTAILSQTVRLCCMRPRPRTILGRGQAAHIEVPRLRCWLATLSFTQRVTAISSVW